MGAGEAGGPQAASCGGPCRMRSCTGMAPRWLVDARRRRTQDFCVAARRGAAFHKRRASYGEAGTGSREKREKHRLGKPETSFLSQGAASTAYRSQLHSPAWSALMHLSPAILKPCTLQRVQTRVGKCFRRLRMKWHRGRAAMGLWTGGGTDVVTLGVATHSAARQACTDRTVTLLTSTESGAERQKMTAATTSCACSAAAGCSGCCWPAPAAPAAAGAAAAAAAPAAAATEPAGVLFPAAPVRKK